MVCLGNICRSPMAEGILKAKARELGIEVTVDSAGTSDWHRGELPDPRAISEMAAHGIDITDQRSRPFSVEDFDLFDHILVMDTANRDNVLRMARSQADRDKVSLILDHGNAVKGRSVPDPYYDDGFGRVHELLEYACGAFLKG
jgi:protein-tyrosine phosphatase